MPGTLGSLTMQRTDETPNRKLSSNRNRKKTNKASTRREEVEDARARTWPSERSLQGALPTKQRHTSYQHSSANLPTLLRQQGSYRALRHSPTKETQAPTSEKNPKPSLSLSAVRKVRPDKHEGGLRGQLRATDATTGATVGATSNDYRQYVLLPTCTTHENPSEQNPKKPSEHRRAAGRRF